MQTACSTSHQENILTELQRAATSKFTGSLTLSASKSIRWTYYFRLGQLVWQDGGLDTQGWWRRQLLLQRLDLGVVQFRQLQQESPNEYTLLAKLLFQGSVTREQVVELIRDRLIESIFDVQQLQAQYFAKPAGCVTDSAAQRYFEVKTVTGEAPDQLLALIAPHQVIEQAHKLWQQWQAAGLAACPPGTFPVIRNLALLKAQNLSASDIKILRAIDGTKSFRELAAMQSRDVLHVVAMILPLIKLGTIRFSRVPVTTRRKPKSARPRSLEQKKVMAAAAKVVCIDDSSASRKQLVELFHQINLDCLQFEDPFKALVALIKHEPEIIFLDLMMPKMSGFELCSRIRSIPQLEKVPIVILTGKDGLTDRLRSKFAGATEFLAKPVEAEKLYTIAQKYLPQTAAA